MFKFIEKTKIWFTISIVLILIGMGSFAFKGLNYGIDFKGGTTISITMEKGFKKADVDAVVDKYAKDKYSSKVANDNTEYNLIVREGALSDKNRDTMLKEIKTKYSLKDSAVSDIESIGASVGNELKQKSLIALAVATVGMLIYVSVRFEFNFALAAVIALVHDVLITIGFYSVFNVQVNTPFIAAILTIVGYSINDTIVVFDRIRENNKKSRRLSVKEIANTSINETLARSINTTLTTLFTIVCVYIFVPSIREFSLPLIIGIVSGAYSSIFVASPLWVILKERKNKKIKAV